MSRNIIKEFEKLGMSITWTLIDIGYKGSEAFKDQLSVQEIINYAILLLESGQVNEKIINIAGESHQNEEKANEYIKILAKSENVDRELEYEKWIVWYVNHGVQEKFEDPITGLLELGNLWLSLGEIPDCPHVFQGVNNDILPEEYYTRENYERLYNAHKEWLKEKIRYICTQRNH